MTSRSNDMAALMGWLEENYGHIQAQEILGSVTKIQHKEDPLECMEIMFLAEIIHAYRKDILSHIKEYKALRAKEYAQAVATFHVRKELKCIKEAIANNIACLADLREIYFFERALYMERCKWPQSVAVLSNPRYEQQSPSRSV